MKKSLTLLALSLFALSTALARTEYAAAPAANGTASTCSAPTEMPQPAFKLTFGQKIAHALLEKRLKKQLRKQGFPMPKTPAGGCDTIVMKDGRMVLGEVLEVTAEGVFYSKCGANDDTRRLISAENVAQVKYAVKTADAQPLTTEEHKLDKTANRALTCSILTNIAPWASLLFLALAPPLGLVTALAFPVFLVLTLIYATQVMDKARALPASASAKQIRRKARTAMWLLLLVLGSLIILGILVAGLSLA